MIRGTWAEISADGATVTRADTFLIRLTEDEIEHQARLIDCDLTNSRLLHSERKTHILGFHLFTGMNTLFLGEFFVSHKHSVIVVNCVIFFKYI